MSTYYKAVGESHVVDRFHMVLRCAAHLDHHVGRMICLCRELKSSSQ